jgi:myosin heavy subunit
MIDEFTFFFHHQVAGKYKLAHPKNFNYLNQSHTYELQGVSDADEYLKTRRAMDIVGICFADQVNPNLIPSPDETAI